MNRRERRLWISAVVASLALHAGLLTLVALHAPVLRGAHPPEGLPVPVIPVLITPRIPPPPGVNAPPQVIHLHRRHRNLPPPPPTPAPLAAPPPPPAAPTPAPPRPAAPAPSLDAGVRAALRHGVVGCNNPDAVGLSQAERQVCEQAFASRKVQIPPSAGLGLPEGKEAAFDRAAAARQEDWKYVHGAVVAPSHMHEPGHTVDDMAKGMGNAHPDAKFRF